MILSLISQKGGVGKSTLARLISVEMARAGWRVLIADLDAAQGTSTKWRIRRNAAGLEPDIDVITYRSAAKALDAAAGYDLAVLDGPAQAERGGVAIAARSDLVVIPTGYSFDDLEPQVGVALELERAGVPAGRIRLALVRVRGSAAEARDVRDYIRRAGLTAFAAELRELPTIRHAHLAGRAASEAPHRKIAGEAGELAHEIATTLTETTHA